MPSPFPGMDPYLERPSAWPGHHTDLLVEFERQLRPILLPNYDAVKEQTIYLHEPSAAARVREADAAVALRNAGGLSGSAATATATRPDARVTYSTEIEQTRHRYLEIRTIDGDRVVTVIELLSPANKDRHRDEYLKKRKEIIDAGVHLLQVDLLRAGRRLLPSEAEHPAHDYDAMLVRAGGRPPEAELWYWTVRDPLPRLPVPLGEGDGDVVLDLRAALDAAYDAGLYARRLYGRSVEPPLSGDDAGWSAGVLGTAGHEVE